MTSKQKTLKQIAPRWWRFIQKHGIEKIYDAGRMTRTYSIGRGIPLLSIGSSANCIMGEAYGFNSDYTLPGSGKFCSECEHLSIDLCTHSPEEFMPVVERLEDHWNEEHVAK